MKLSSIFYLFVAASKDKPLQEAQPAPRKGKNSFAIFTFDNGDKDAWIEVEKINIENKPAPEKAAPRELVELFRSKVNFVIPSENLNPRNFAKDSPSMRDILNYEGKTLQEHFDEYKKYDFLGQKDLKTANKALESVKKNLENIPHGEIEEALEEIEEDAEDIEKDNEDMEDFIHESFVDDFVQNLKVKTTLLKDAKQFKGNITSVFSNSAFTSFQSNFLDKVRVNNEDNLVYPKIENRKIKVADEALESVPVWPQDAKRSCTLKATPLFKIKGQKQRYQYQVIATVTLTYQRYLMSNGECRNLKDPVKMKATITYTPSERGIRASAKVLFSKEVRKEALN